MRSDYKICPLCGASLDVGEICDCEKEKTCEIRPTRDFKNKSIEIHVLLKKTSHGRKITA